MATQSPVFSIPEPHHFSDYGFDPQIDYFQVLEEARRHKRESSSSSGYYSRSIDTLHFKLQKPISKDDPYHFSKMKKMKNSTKKRRWWKKAIIFIKSRWSPHSSRPINPLGPTSISGPIYLTESFGGSATSSRSSTPARKGQIGIPYVSLRELNMDPPPPMPIYLVT
ncbi:hypothetical protein V2J09_015867 [Rumex salicifolius]